MHTCNSSRLIQIWKNLQSGKTSIINCISGRLIDQSQWRSNVLIIADEIAKVLECLGLESDPFELTLKSAINSFLKSGNAGLTFNDFAALHKSVDEALFADEGKIGGADSQDELDLMEAFKVVDEDGEKSISVRELQVVLDKLGLPEARETERVTECMKNSEGYSGASPR